MTTIIDFEAEYGPDGKPIQDPKPKANGHAADGSTSISGSRPEEVARIQDHLMHDPDPPDEWEPGSLARGIWNRALGRRESWRCDPVTGTVERGADGDPIRADAPYEVPAQADAPAPVPELAIMDRLGARYLDQISSARPAPLLIERLDPEGHTILYGDGGVGKGALACDWIVQLAHQGHRILILDYEDHPGEWARRIASLGDDVRSQVAHVSPMAASWTGKRGAIWGQQDDIRALADDVGATFVVIDSIVPACGGTDALKPEAAAQYAGAVAYIGRPALSLAHVTKAIDLRYPFGSAFWHHLARMTWSVAKAGGPGHRVILAHRKHNNYPGQGKFLLTIVWVDDLPVDVMVQGYTSSIQDDIEDVMGDDTMTVTQIVDRLNQDLDGDDDTLVKDDSVRAALRRGAVKSPPRFVVDGEGAGARWRLA